ncbi:MFS transporter [Streptomyces sp. NPDC001255]|uniref:MFS transporter n=1 Tax=Streptomyces sp. NPDC001255 TaxID=3364550 RepID=UPI003677676F
MKRPATAAGATGLVRALYLPRTADALALAMSTYGIPLVVLATTNSAALTGLAFTLEWVPRLAAFGGAGALVDRYGSRTVFVLASLARALVLAAGAAVLAVHPDGRAASATVMVLAASTGVLAEVSYLATETAGAAVAREAGERAHRVQGTLLGIDQSATMAGPALAGLLLAAGAPQMLAVVTVCSALASLFARRTPLAEPTSAAAGASVGSPSGGLRAGLRTVRSLPALAWLVAGLAASNLATGFLQAAGPVMVTEHYGRSATAAGLVWSAAAAATLVAVTTCRFAIDRAGLWRVGASCAILASLACLATARAPGYRSYLVLVAVLMAAEGGMAIVLRTVRARLIPTDAAASTLAATILILLSPFPLAGLLTALTPPDLLGHVLAACAVLQAIGLATAFTRLRSEPAARI